MDFAQNLFAATLFIHNKDVSKSFYAQVFDKAPVFEDENSVVFKFGSTMINLLLIGEAPSLINPAPVSAAETGSRFQFTIQVPSVDEHSDRLKSLGIDLVNGPMDRPWGIRTLLIADPDGHLWEFAQDL